jgi:hypothetical protein
MWGEKIKKDPWGGKNKKKKGLWLAFFLLFLFLLKLCLSKKRKSKKIASHKPFLPFLFLIRPFLPCSLGCYAVKRIFRRYA